MGTNKKDSREQGTDYVKTKYLLIAFTVLALCVFIGGLVIYLLEGDPQPRVKEEYSWPPHVDSALEQYIAKDDGYFQYEYLRSDSYTEPGVDVHVYNMTSQRWLNDTQLYGFDVNGNRVDRSIWWHGLHIIIPKDLEPRLVDSCVLIIDGGNNDIDENDLLAWWESAKNDWYQEASKAGICVAIVSQVPNQPVIFTNDEKKMERIEDDIIAYGWRQFLEINANNPEIEDTEWLLRLPMTKAAVKAMDAVSQIVPTHRPEYSKEPISQFVVGGWSKRGWTSWLTGAVDPRVKAIFPVVDAIRGAQQWHSMFKSLGGWSTALAAYCGEEIMEWLDTPEFDTLLKHVDPFSYRERLTLPKLIISASSDAYFLPDDTHFYLKELTGEGALWEDSVNFVSMHANQGHMSSFFNPMWREIAATAMSFARQTLLPDWYYPVVETSYTTTDEDGSVRIKINKGGNFTVSKVTRWTAYTKDLTDGRRDFRNKTLVPWEPISMTDPSWDYKWPQANPETGYAAFFIEVQLTGPEGTSMQISTETVIIPNTYNFEDCSGASCQCLEF